jgi:S-formylglutathione hydrolase
MLAGWTRTTVAAKAVDLFEPVGSAARFAAVYLHPVGLESLSENVVFTQLLQKHRLACCAPLAGRCWWVDRVCPEFDPTLTAEQFVVRELLPWMQTRWPSAAKGPALFGISMGGQGAIRLGFKSPTLFPIVAGIASAFDFHEWHGRGTPLDTMYRNAHAARQDTAILQVNPNQYPPAIWFACDPDDLEWYRGNDRLHEKLTAIGIPHTADLTSRHGGHSWPYFEAMAEPALAFVVAALEKQARRLA